ncbi:MAG: hypothetical protein R3D86_13250 [Emcibacteraceae bacterium]
MMDKNVIEADFTGQEIPVLGSQNEELEWIEAGIKLLRDHGPHLITINDLCAKLEKPETEFNRIFKTKENYLFAILDHWYEKETLSYIDMMDEIGGSAENIIMTMVEVIHHADKQDEIAIRNWALKCPNAHAALAKVDRTRLDVASGLFKEMGFSESESKLRAKIMYTSSIGTHYTSISESLEHKKAMCELLLKMD